MNGTFAGPGLTRGSVLVGILVLFAALFPFWGTFDSPGMNMDEGMLLLYPERVLKGDLPYRDFETFYGPANIYALAGVYSVFGVSLEVERAVGLIYRALLLGGIFLFMRRWGSTLAALGTMIAAFFVLATNLLAFAWLGGVACVLWSLLCLAGNPQPWRVGVAGFLAAMALLYRQDLGLAVIASALPLFLLMSARQRWIYLGSAALGMMPLLLLATATGIGPLVDNLFLYPVVISNPGRRLPLSVAPDELVFLFCLHVGAAVCAVVTGFLLCRENRQSTDARLFLAFALLALGFTHQGMQRADSIHVTMTAFLSMAMLPASFAILARRARLEVPPLGWALAGGATVVAMLASGAPDHCELYLEKHKAVFSTEPSTVKMVRVRDRQFPAFISSHSQHVVSFLEEQTKPGDRLFVGTGDLRRAFANDTFIYHLLPWLQPATYFLEMNPLSANRPDSRLARDVASADWLVLNRAWDFPREPNLSCKNGPNAPNEVVRTQFEWCGGSGPYQVFHRRHTAAVTAVSAKPGE